MSKASKNIVSFLYRHKTKRTVLIKFILLVIILLAYAAFLSYQYGFKDGGWLAVLSWSFFVLCTPVADAGFLLDFPLRLLLNIRMLHSEIFVWSIAVSLNIFTLFFDPALYEKTFLTHLFHKILLTPYPYWSIILLSALGTFLSVIFGDELLDVVSQKERRLFHRHGWKLELVIMLFIFSFTFLAYRFLLETLDIKF